MYSSVVNCIDLFQFACVFSAQNVEALSIHLYLIIFCEYAYKHYSRKLILVLYLCHIFLVSHIFKSVEGVAGWMVAVIHFI